MALTNQLYHTSIKIGEDAQTQIDFETANEIHFDADNAERVKIDSTGLTVVSGNLDITSGSLETATIDYTDGDLAMTIADGGGVTFAQTVNLSASTDLQFNSTAILSDSAGTMTLSNIDALDATTEATIEAAIDTLGAVTTGTITVTDDGVINLGDEGQLVFTDDAPSTNQTGTGIVLQMTALTGLGAMECVYIDSNGKLDEADADAATTMPAIGIALEANASGSDAEVKVLVQGVVTNSSWSFTPGADLFVGTTDNAGEVTATAPSGSGDTVQKIGVALTATSAYFNFNTTEVVLA